MNVNWTEPIKRKLEEYGWDVPMFAERLAVTPYRANQIIEMDNPQIPIIIKVEKVLLCGFEIFGLGKVYRFICEKGMDLEDLAKGMGMTKDAVRKMLRRIDENPLKMEYQQLLRVAMLLEKDVREIGG